MSDTQRMFHGIAASPGSVIAPARLILHDRVSWRRYHITKAQDAAEITRLERAVKAAIAALSGVRERFAGEAAEHISLLDAHVMMLQDPALEIGRAHV